jgi:hypothetical protein
VIWPDPARRALALGVCLGSLVLTWQVLRRGALTQRTVVEVCQEHGQGRFQIISSGRALAVPVEIHTLTRQETSKAASGDLLNLNNVQRLLFHLPTELEGELKLWLHQVDPAGISSGLPARCRWAEAPNTAEYLTTPTQAEILMPWDKVARVLEVCLLRDQVKL